MSPIYWTRFINNTGFLSFLRYLVDTGLAGHGGIGLDAIPLLAIAARYTGIMIHGYH